MRIEYWYHAPSGQEFSINIDDYTEQQYMDIANECERLTEEEYVVLAMITKYGEDSQLDVVVEELSELIKEVTKYKRSKIHEREREDRRLKVLDEIGDVMFMVQYLKVIFKIDDETIKNAIREKAKRTNERYLK